MSLFLEFSLLLSLTDLSLGSNQKKKVTSKRSMLNILQSVLSSRPSNIQQIRSESGQQGLSVGQLCGVAGCKASSDAIVKQLRAAGANRLGSKPCAPLDTEFEEHAQFTLWASYLGERSLCPVAYIGEGELYHGASGKFYYHILTLVFPLGFTVESVISVFTNIKEFNALQPASILDDTKHAYLNFGLKGIFFPFSIFFTSFPFNKQMCV
jgi:hypothetical protein